MATRFQQLGAYVGEAQNVSYDRLRRFHEIGGRYILPLISQVGYPWDHDPACVRNRAFLLQLKEWCDLFDPPIALGGWFRLWANTSPAEAADEIERYVKGYNLMPVSLNCESEYKAVPQEFPATLLEVRRRIKTRSIFVSVIDLNDAMIWNGGNLGHAACTRALGVRVSPQWYSSPNYPERWFDPYQNMVWLNEHGTQGNFHCAVYKNHKAVPLSYVKGTLEVTGLENASLKTSIESLGRAKAAGLYDFGYSLYLLENMPLSDFPLVAATRGRLYLV